MNFIIFDLEATCWRDRPVAMQQEIIEIGALLIDPYGAVHGEFNRFVRPVIHPRLSAFCTELTTIQQEQVDKAATFPEVMEEFQDWGEIFDEEYLLCSWGKFDKQLLFSDCALHECDEDWVEHHINLKQQYREIKGLRRAIGLKSAIRKEGFDFSGVHHRAIDDARNLAKIFLKMRDMWQF